MKDLNKFLEDNKDLIEENGKLDLHSLLCVLECYDWGTFFLKSVSVKNNGFTYYLLEREEDFELFTLREWDRCGYGYNFV